MTTPAANRMACIQGSDSPARARRDTPRRVSSSGPLAERVLETMARCVGSEELTLEWTARIAGLSARTLQRRLARERTSFSRLLDRARYQAAVELISESDARLVDVCVAVGYDSQSSFARAFRRWAGVPPSEYRRLRRRSTDPSNRSSAAARRGRKPDRAGSPAEPTVWPGQQASRPAETRAHA